MKSVKILNYIEDWENLKKTEEKIAVIFKYSPYCSISLGVERNINAWAKDTPEDAPFTLAEVDVVSSREVSQAIARELGIRHESPQLIILNKDKTPVWHESHYDITIEDIKKQLAVLLPNGDK